jgi:RNA polymerase-binding transcription factor DksA
MSASPSQSVPAHQERAGLTRDQIDALRKLLETERAALSERALVFIDEHGQIDPTAATHGQGETEHTATEVEQRVADVLETNTREALAEISDALERMDAGTYGLCEDCGSPIPGERLVALPAARFCVACQARHDSRR